MKYGYCRVSTSRQATQGNSLEFQQNQVTDHGAEKIFVDTYTGTSMQRPELQRIIKEIHSGDWLIVTKLDRFARTAWEASKMISELIDKGVVVYVIELGVMDNSPGGILVRNVMLAVAQFGRDTIVENTQNGRAIARQKEGYREGRKPKYKQEHLLHAIELLNSNSYYQVERLTGISKSTLIRAKKRLKK